MIFGSPISPVSARAAMLAVRHPDALMVWIRREQTVALKTAPPWRRVESLASDVAVPFVNGDAEARWIAERDAEPLPRLDDDEHLR